MGDESSCKKHFVLVHGATLVAWCWYKVKPLLEAAGHRVTPLDMAASGLNPKTIHEIHGVRDYTEPLIVLLTSLPDDQKVVLVGHSLGGLNLALAMEMLPHKIEIAVFLSAFLPDYVNTPPLIGYMTANNNISLLENNQKQFVAQFPDENYWLDTESKNTGDPKETLTTMLFGPQFFANLSHLSFLEDYELTLMLKRPSSLFLHDAWKPESKLSKERYESVRTAYVICNEDKGISENFQRWMIENHGVKEVKELKDSDHMPMFCMPKQLCDCLLEIAQN